MMTHFRGKAALRQIGGNIEAASNGGKAQKLLRELRNIIREMVERIVTRVYGPDDRVHGADSITGGRGNLVQIRADFVRTVTMFLPEFGEQCDAGEGCPQLVMNILGNARALFLQRVLLLQLLKFTPKPSDRPVAHGRAATTENDKTSHGSKPPGLPERRQDSQRKGCRPLVPDAI